jgi:hypothetical protein
MLMPQNQQVNRSSYLRRRVLSKTLCTSSAYVSIRGNDWILPGRSSWELVSKTDGENEARVFGSAACLTGRRVATTKLYFECVINPQQSSAAVGDASRNLTTDPSIRTAF